MTTADLHTATGAYVLHALAPAERAAFERHLAACAACAQEVRELAATAARLGLAVPATPPPQLREQVLRQITTVRQEPPRVPAPPRVRAWSWSWRASRRASRLVLAACLAAAAAFGGVAVWQHQSAEDARTEARRAERQAEQRAAELAAVLAAPDARTVTAKLADGARATVVVSEERDRAAFLASALPDLPTGKVYQLWFDDEGKMRSAGLLTDSGGTNAVLMEGAVDDASGMGVTVEPSGGSPAPTTPPIGLMKFPT
ncbi:anti-sigma factor [Streptomyces kanamyceticus]|uniref:Regulator of SigK n=1 Tax=Streptomyces kanamyceticus TaxID=1967 RepID=A0A5J6GFU6_STRKN|nr:anti-sigma factor [Streptomyces kanamyceticus]QEU92811.1 anti-sigma factor [Streptomyces kanamyceticus]